MYKYKPQSSNFKKQKYSLYCMLKYVSKDDLNYNYLYHLSVEMKHNYVFEALRQLQLITFLNLGDDSEILCFKSDHSATQYKRKYIFNY